MTGSNWQRPTPAVGYWLLDQVEIAAPLDVSDKQNHVVGRAAPRTWIARAQGPIDLRPRCSAHSTRLRSAGQLTHTNEYVDPAEVARRLCLHMSKAIHLTVSPSSEPGTLADLSEPLVGASADVEARYVRRVRTAIPCPTAGGPRPGWRTGQVLAMLQAWCSSGALGARSAADTGMEVPVHTPMELTGVPRHNVRSGAATPARGPLSLPRLAQPT